MSYKKYIKPISNSVLPPRTNGFSSGVHENWLPEVYSGPANRLQRYIQYDQMEYDHEVSAALDIISEFSTQPDAQNSCPFVIKFKENVTTSETKVLDEMLKNWCYINKFQKRMFKIFRSTLKYGDQFFIRDPETYELMWVDPSFVEKIIVNESNGKEIDIYFVKDINLNLAQQVASDMHGTNTNRIAPMGTQSSYVNTPISLIPVGNIGSNIQNYTGQEAATPVDSKHVVQISLSEGMDSSWPFGNSILERIFKAYKQKELLEDAILIYRIHRAPERRVFKIDVGGLHPTQAAQYIERCKNEMQQKRMPSRNSNGGSIVDGTYNPLSTLEDYFFAVTPDGRGSNVERLDGGDALGTIDDLLYFNNKMLRALSIPSSYISTGPTSNQETVKDGTLGQAYIEEFRFNKYCMRLQTQIVQTFDVEFKLYLKWAGITVDSSIFDLCFTEPQNFAAYRELNLQKQRIDSYSSIKGDKTLSTRFKLKKYLGLTEFEMKENEQLWLEENKGKDMTDGESDMVDELGGGPMSIGMSDVGVSPSEFDAGSMPDELNDDGEMQSSEDEELNDMSDDISNEEPPNANQ